MRIKLNEISHEGEEFKFTRATGELNKALKDLIADKDYEVSFRITPLGEVYEIRGSFKAPMNLVCSRCAFDFCKDISEDFTELLMVSEPLPRNGKRAKNQEESNENQGPFCNEIESNDFDIGSYVHEIIAAAEPVQPLGTDNCDNTCENYQSALKEGWLKPQKQEDTHRPFASLSQLKH